MFILYRILCVYLIVFLPTSNLYGFESWLEIKNKNVERQQYDYSCGTSSLVTIIKYFYGENINETMVLEYLNSKKKEDDLYKITFDGLLNFSKIIGFKSVGINIDNIDKFYKIKIPLILQVKIRGVEHFTVFKGIDKNYVYLADPSIGNLKLKIHQFAESFYFRKNKNIGRALVVFPKDPKNMNHDFLKLPKFSKNIYSSVINNHKMLNYLK